MSTSIRYYLAAQLLLLGSFALLTQGLDQVASGACENWCYAQPMLAFFVPGVGMSLCVWFIALATRKS